jgi:hypothetical protein
VILPEDLFGRLHYIPPSCQIPCKLISKQSNEENSLKFHENFDELHKNSSDEYFELVYGDFYAIFFWNSLDGCP